VTKLLALLDWDGTLRRKFTILDWYDHLDEYTRLPASLFDELRALLPVIGYEDFAERVVNIYAVGMWGVSVEFAQSQLTTFIEESAGIFDLTVPLIDYLIARHLTPVVITGSPVDVVAAELNSVERPLRVCGTKLTITGGEYTSDALNLAVSDGKRNVLERLTAGDTTVAISFGDSESDKSLMVESAVHIRVLHEYSAGALSNIGWTAHETLASNSSSDTIQKTLDPLLKARGY
jgi:phosphoserine phosphatase